MKLTERLFGKWLDKIRAQQKGAEAIRDTVNEPLYDFYRCGACHALITKLDEFNTFDPASPRFGTVCSCGHRRYSPTNLLWYEWLLPRVWKFALVRVMGAA